MAEIVRTSYASDVVDELSLTASAHAEDVTGEVSLTSSAYGEDVADAINDLPIEPATLKVMQLNIGHFNMGTAAAPTSNNPNANNVLISSAKSDGYPNSINRNYATQLQRWKSLVAHVDADIISLPEYNKYFGWLNGSVVETEDTDIFNGYDLSVGAIECNGWWQNTLASKLAMNNAENVYLGSTNGILAYLRVAKVTIKGIEVWIASTHLNWNNPTGTGGASASYASRQKEIKEIVKWMQGKNHVILMGDFNTTGIVYADSVPVADRDYQAGLNEFAPFIDGFTEDGVTYEGGCTLANSRQRPLLTADATDSRPDTDAPSAPYCYIDNIIVKGFTMSNVQVLDTDLLNDTLDIGMLADHCAVVCELTIIQEGGAV